MIYQLNGMGVTRRDCTSGKQKTNSVINNFYSAGSRKREFNILRHNITLELWICPPPLYSGLLRLLYHRSAFLLVHKWHNLPPLFIFKYGLSEEIRGLEIRDLLLCPGRGTDIINGNLWDLTHTSTVWVEFRCSPLPSWLTWKNWSSLIVMLACEVTLNLGKNSPVLTS